MDPRAVAERALTLFFVARPPSPRGGAAEELARLLRGASARALRVVERFSRDRRAHDRLGLPFADLRVEDLDGLAAEPAPMGLLAMATMARSGYVRQAAMERLDEHVEPLTFGLLLSRLNDPVRFVAAAADAALRRQLVHLPPAGLVRYLPLLDALDSWKRSRDHAVVPLVEARLRSPAGAAALREAASDRDVDLQLAALRRLAVFSDLGTREDLELVRPFADDARASVAAEAERTVTLLTA